MSCEWSVVIDTILSLRLTIHRWQLTRNLTLWILKIDIKLVILHSLNYQSMIISTSEFLVTCFCLIL